MAAVWRRLCAVAPQCSRVIKAPPVFINRSKLYEAPRHLGGIHRRFCSAKPLPQKDKVTIHFTMADGEKRSVQAKVGDNLLDVIIENDVDIDGFGACEGTLACSTCHLIFNPADFKKLPEKPTDEELDMLDLAFSLTDESRLGCQVIVSKEMEGWEVKVPEGVADAREP